jgi:hypothetical protein
MTTKDNEIKERHVDNDKNYSNQSYNNKSNEQFVKINWWINELDSLGIKAKKINVLNDTQELGNLTDNIKQTFYQDYKTCYSEDIN